MKRGHFITIKLVAIADTHGHYPKLPEGDVLVHAGDGTMMGTEEEIRELDDWFSTLTFKHIIYVPGNHDFLFEIENILRNAIVLINQQVVIDGIKFWGSPYCPTFGAWAFMKSDNELNTIWQCIPDDVNVLITHGPPRGMLDRTVAHATVGSLSLLDRVREVKPKYHIFGHIHEAYGNQYNRRTLFANVSIVNEYYKKTNKPLVIGAYSLMEKQRSYKPY